MSSHSSDSPAVPFKKDLNPLFPVSGESFPFEDPFLWFDATRGRFFCILKDNDGVASGTHQSSLVLFESPDAKTWMQANPFLVSDLTLHWADRPAQAVSHMERPQITFDEQGKPLMLVVAISAPGTRETDNVRIPLQA